jgi:hypothetical protein
VRNTLLVRQHAAGLIDQSPERKAAVTCTDAASKLASLALAPGKRSG